MTNSSSERKPGFTRMLSMISPEEARHRSDINAVLSKELDKKRTACVASGDIWGFFNTLAPNQELTNSLRNRLTEAAEHAVQTLDENDPKRARYDAFMYLTQWQAQTLEEVAHAIPSDWIPMVTAKDVNGPTKLK